MHINHKIRIILAVLIVSFLVSSCTKGNNLSGLNYCQELKFDCYNRKILIKIKTNKGDIFIELDGENAPLTSGNFINLIQNKYYDNIVINRVIKEPKPFILEVGFRTSLNPTKDKTKFYKNKSNYQKSSSSIPLEIRLSGDNEPIYNKLINPIEEKKNIVLVHKKGSIAMSRSLALDSANTRFYITLRDAPELDGRFAVFGRVIKGMDIVDLLSESDTIISIKIDEIDTNN